MSVSQDPFQGLRLFEDAVTRLMSAEAANPRQVKVQVGNGA